MSEILSSLRMIPASVLVPFTVWFMACLFYGIYRCIRVIRTTDVTDALVKTKGFSAAYRYTKMFEKALNVILNAKLFSIKMLAILPAVVSVEAVCGYAMIKSAALGSLE